MQFRNFPTYLGNMFSEIWFELNFGTTSRQPWRLSEALSTPMDAPRPVIAEDFSFSPRSQSSDQILQKNIPDLGLLANSGLEEYPGSPGMNIILQPLSGDSLFFKGSRVSDLMYFGYLF